MTSSPPVSVVNRLNGGSVSTPTFPLCALGLQQDQLLALYGADDQLSWRGATLQLGHAPFDSKYSAARHAFFESLTPIEGSLAPAPRHLLNPCFDAAQGGEDSGRNVEIGAVAFETAASVTSLGVDSDEPGELLRANVADIPVSLVRAIGARRD